MDKSYQNFLESLAARESGGNYQAINSYGYLGKYQMGEAALIDSGYYTKDGTANNDWRGQWTGKDGISSSIDFLKNTDAQETAIRDYMSIQWKYIEHFKLDEYVGKELNGITITESGLLAGAHLKGVGGLKDAIENELDGQFTDAYGTDIQEYIANFGNFETPYEIDTLLLEENEEEIQLQEQLDVNETEQTGNSNEILVEDNWDNQDTVTDSMTDSMESAAPNQEMQDDTSSDSSFEPTEQMDLDVSSDDIGTWDSEW